MRIIATILLLSQIILSESVNTLDREYKLMTNEQKMVLKRAFESGKEYDLGYTLAAIAWVESQAGLYQINLQDPSAGIFHNNIISVLGRHKEWENTPFRRNMIAQRLIDDYDFAISETLSELEFWRLKHGNDWRKVWSSYNGGYSWGCKQAVQYAEKVGRRIKVLRKYFK